MKYYFEDYKNLSWLEIEAIVYYHAGSLPQIHFPVSILPRKYEVKIPSTEVFSPKNKNSYSEQYNQDFYEIRDTGAFINIHTPIMEELNYLDRLINSETPLSIDMRRFIADVISERVKPKKQKKRSTVARDEKIHREVEYCLLFDNERSFDKKGNLKNVSLDKALANVAEYLGLKFGNMESIRKAYTRYEKKLNYDGDMLDFLKSIGFDVGEMKGNL
ncbi:MAG: hypothetical protein RIQ94_3379 [Pseudomonadota bacterium]|jgi:hypothetical protein